MYLPTDLCIYLPVSGSRQGKLFDGQEPQVKAVFLLLLLLLLLLLRLLLLLLLLWLYHWGPKGG